MKKKLKLNRESIRSLTGHALRKAAGAMTGGACSHFCSGWLSGCCSDCTADTSSCVTCTSYAGGTC